MINNRVSICQQFALWKARKMILKGSRVLWLYLLISICVISVIILYKNSGQEKTLHYETHQEELGHGHPNDIFISNFSERVFKNLCFETLNGFGRSISDTYDKIELLKVSKLSECQHILQIFQNIFQFERIETSLVLPQPFQSQVKKWLGNDEKLFGQIYQQRVYKVVNKLTGEETIFNLLRSKRPVTFSGVDPLEYVEKLTQSSKENCDFCNYREHTASDNFGRIENKMSATCSNTFKLAKFHGLFFPLLHHPLNISYDVLVDLFLHTSQQWFKKAYETDQTQRYPTLLWDSLPHAGASQVHPHVHGLLDPQQYSGAFEVLRQGAAKYFEEYRRSFWTDFIKVHMALGLTVQKGDAIAIVPITARKDHEYWVLSPLLDESVIKLLFRILQGYRNQLNTFCHSAGASYPPLGKTQNSYDGLPVLFRIGSRGDCTSIRSDVSSLELYTLNNINTNLAQTISALEENDDI